MVPIPVAVACIGILYILQGTLVMLLTFKKIFFSLLLFSGTFWLSGFVLQDEGRHKKKGALSLMQRKDLAHNPDEFLEDVSIYDLHLDSLKKTFCWKVRGDSVGRRYYVEEKRWNRFYKLKEVSAQPAGSNSYAVHVPMDSVLYYVCVKYYRKGAWSGRGLELEVKDDEDLAVNCTLGMKRWPLIRKTRWEIYDKYGNIVRSNFSDEINVDSLPPDVYYLNYANRTVEFISRKGK